MHDLFHSVSRAAASALKLALKCQSVAMEGAGIVADVLLREEAQVKFGSRYLVARSTPGHTDSCCTYVADDVSRCFVGDTLLVRGSGRVDLQGGSSRALYESVHSVIFSLPDRCIVLPAHDYSGLII